MVSLIKSMMLPRKALRGLVIAISTIMSPETHFAVGFLLSGVLINGRANLASRNNY